MDTTQLGYLAALLTTGSFLPQVLHTLRTRDTHSISLSMYLMLVCGTGTWLLYGLSIAALPVVLANALSMLMSSVILVVKLREVVRTRTAKSAP